MLAPLRTVKHVALGAALGLLGPGLAGCGSPPVRHPVSLIQERMRPRIALVEFIVKDPSRRERVTRILLEIEELTFAWQRDRLALRSRIFTAGSDGEPPTDQELEALFAQSLEESGAYFDRYVELQLALRAATTEAEFARLDRIK
ncbi:MAG: hypothetical protein ACFCGT_11395 [Sandaracinaceae bacterium]